MQQPTEKPLKGNQGNVALVVVGCFIL